MLRVHACDLSACLANSIARIYRSVGQRLDLFPQRNCLHLEFSIRVGYTTLAARSAERSSLALSYSVIDPSGCDTHNIIEKLVFGGTDAHRIKFINFADMVKKSRTVRVP
jgi:hypothetical protein